MNLFSKPMFTKLHLHTRKFFSWVKTHLSLHRLGIVTEDFSIHWRENYEQQLGKWWLAIALVYLLVGIIVIRFFITDPILAHKLTKLSALLALWCFSWMIVRYLQGNKNQQWLAQRYHRKILITTSNDLQQNHCHGQTWWLGKGFYWKSIHSFRQQYLQQYLDYNTHAQQTKPKTTELSPSAQSVKTKLSGSSSNSDSTNNSTYDSDHNSNYDSTSGNNSTYNHTSQQANSQSNSQTTNNNYDYTQSDDFNADIPGVKSFNDLQPARTNESKPMGSNWLHTLEYQEQDIYLDCAHTNGHMLIVGTTGSGKTRAFDLLIQQAILRKESVIIIDPKGDHDLREKALATAKKLNMAERFLVFSPAFAKQSIALDLLGNYSKTSDLAQRIISLIPQSANAGPFRAVSYKAVLTIIDALVYLNQKITINRIYICLTVGLKDLLASVMTLTAQKYQLEKLGAADKFSEMEGRTFKAMLKTYVSHYHEQLKIAAVINLIELYNHDHTHLTKMIATLLPGLHVLASSPMSELISPEIESKHQRVLFNLQTLTTNNYVLYVGLDSLSDATLSGNIGSLLLSDLSALAGMIYNYNDIKKPINIFVDEAAEVVNDAFIQILNKGRGAGLRCFTATQTIADFNVRTGSYDKTRQMLGNFNNWLALRTNDYDTQKYLAESLRTTRIGVRNTSYNSQGITADSSKNESLHYDQNHLITPDIFAELPNFEYIARVAGGELIKGRLPVVNHD